MGAPGTIGGDHDNVSPEHGDEDDAESGHFFGLMTVQSARLRQRTASEVPLRHAHRLESLG